MDAGKGSIGIRRNSNVPWQNWLMSTQASPTPASSPGGFQNPEINQQGPGPAVPAGQAAGLAQAPQPAQPGISGITPGGLERRMVNQAPSNQLRGDIPNPSSLQSAPSFNGDEIRQPERMSVQGSTIGPDIQNLRDPLMLIRRMLQGGMG